MPQHTKNCVFLVDTYDTLRIGVPAAIQVARELGDKINFLGVRIDSGDMAYISKKFVNNWMKQDLRMLRSMHPMILMKIPFLTLKCRGLRLTFGELGLN